MANNELSGPIVTAALAREISKRDNFYSYRFVFLPETIGSIAYISSNIKRMKKDIIAGFMVTCVGDNKNLSYLPSRDGNTLSDKAALHVLKILMQILRNISGFIEAAMKDSIVHPV